MSLVARRIDDARQTRSAYLIGCARTGEAIVVDPPRDTDRCIETAARDGLRIAAVADTQVHADILSGARELAERTGAMVLASAAGGPDCTPRWVSKYSHRLVRDGDIIDIGGARLRALHTPGAAPEALAFAVSDGATEHAVAVVVGRLLAPWCDAGDRAESEALRASIQRVLSLPEWTQLWTMHPLRHGAGCMPQTAVGYERRCGQLALAARDPAEFRAALQAAARTGTAPSQRVRSANLEGVPLLARRPQPTAVLALEEREDLLDPAIATVIDTRAWSVFRSGHLAGAIHAPLGRSVASIIATFVEPDERVVLVCDPAHADELVRECVRVGVDRVEALIPPALLHSHRHLLRTAPEVSAGAAEMALRADDVQVIDVRPHAECARGMIPGAVRIAPQELRGQARQFHRWKVIVHCALGAQAASACSVLRRHGVDAVNLAGGIEAWRKAGLPLTAPHHAHTVLARAG